MSDTIDPARRAASVPNQAPAGPVTLINSFKVELGREQAFLALWSDVSGYFRAQPGFVRLRLHRALSPEATYRFVNVAEWESAGEFAAAHASEQFRSLVSRREWHEFASSPALYEVLVEHRAAFEAAV